MKMFLFNPFAIVAEKWSDVVRVLHRKSVKHTYLQMFPALLLLACVALRVTVLYPSKPVQCHT
jgi:hypothetical protein